MIAYVVIEAVTIDHILETIFSPVFSSVQFSYSVVSNSSWPHGPQHARLPCPSPTPGVYSNSSPLSRWCHTTISSSVIPFSSCFQSFSASGSFRMSQLFASGGHSIGVSASTSVLPMNTQDWSPLGWTGWISWQPKGLSRVFSNATVQKHQFFGTQLSLGEGNGNPSVLAWRIPGTAEPGGLPSMGSHWVGHDWRDLAAAAAAFFIVQFSHPYMTTGKTIALTRGTFVGKIMSWSQFFFQGESVF